MPYEVGIIGNTVTSYSNEVFLRKYLRLLVPLSQKVYVISDWNPSLTDDKVIVINTIRLVTQRFNNSSSIIIRSLKLLLIQLIVCANLLTSVRSARVLFVFPTHMALPILCAKLTRRKVVLFVTSRTDVRDITSKKLYQRIIGYLLTTLFTVIFKLVDRIMIESQNLIVWLNLNNYTDKINVGSTFVDLAVSPIRRGITSREVLVGYVGTILESKGVGQFVKSIPLILGKSPNIRFVVIGAGSYYCEIKRIISQQNLNSKIEVEGWISNSEVQSRLVELKLLVLPSSSEGLPNVILEAMACGTPVLATPVGGIPDIIHDGVTGFILDNSSVECIAEGITEL